MGFGAGIAGTAVSNGLLAIRKKLDAKFELQNKPPNVLLNAGCWGTHMAVSSNIRYQLLNGLDMVRHPTVLHLSTSRGSCCMLRRFPLLSRFAQVNLPLYAPPPTDLFAVFTQAVQPVLPSWLFKILSTAIRLLNNVVGGVSFVRRFPPIC